MNVEEEANVAYVYAFDYPHRMPRQELRQLLGGKAANIWVMANELGLPVPPSFTISTEACRVYLSDGWPQGLEDEIREQMGKLEAAIGRRFGDAADPLFVSVRSGAPVSMPGMMDTILNLGLNDTTAQGLYAQSGDQRFVDACRARFSAMYRDIVGVDTVPQDPWEQLRRAVEAVFKSWNSERARSYRAREGIADDLGTAVTVQAMVFGNRGDDSATGVLFTRDPATGEPRLYGDVLFNAQGEDVVSGTSQTEPVDILQERMPHLAEELRGYARMLERHFADMCDIEFTIEQGKLWMLQTRVGKRSPQAALRIALDMALDDEFPLSRAEAVERVACYLADPPKTAGERLGDAPVVARGLAASPGLASGVIATTPDAAVSMADAGQSVILVRKETSPDDVHGMARAAGILTSTGGLASHAAVVARGWGIPAVVGASAVEVDGDVVFIEGRPFAVGDVITIDGTRGEVFAGELTTASEIVPEAQTLLEWAQDVGIDISVPPSDGKRAERDEEIEGKAVVDAGTVLRVLTIKGVATARGLADALGGTVEAVEPILEAFAADGLVKSSSDMFQLTATGKDAGKEAFTDDRELWGKEEAEAALDAFVPLDRRMKDIVTAWQVREVGGELAMNDHTDQAYDASVLGDLVALHHDVSEWLSALGLARKDLYRARLDKAVRLVDAGDHRYVASPRVDSYHSVWFELHEDLILVAGRNRADEVAAGRA